MALQLLENRILAVGNKVESRAILLTATWIGIRHRLIAVIVLFSTSGVFPSSAGMQHGGVALDSEVTIHTRRQQVALRVELARTRSEQRQGLKNRNRLAPDSGMLFVFDEPKVTSMWMVDTYIPLDMIFIDARGVITRIAENAVPLSDALIASGEPVKAVLEINGGTSTRLGIKPGDRVTHPALNTAS